MIQTGPLPSRGFDPPGRDRTSAEVPASVDEYRTGESTKDWDTIENSP